MRSTSIAVLLVHLFIFRFSCSHINLVCIMFLSDGFRKIISTEAVNIKLEKDDMEFAHPYFLKDQEQLLEFIKRKVCLIHD